MKSKPLGFTLVELLTTLAVLTVVITVAIPALSSTTDSIRERTQINQLMGDLNFARSRAITSRRPVSICAGQADCDRLAKWSGQILIFDDLNANGIFDQDDVLLRTTRVEGGHTWTWRNFRQQRYMMFKPDGTTHSLNGTFILCREDTALKKVVINITGRARLASPTAEDRCA